MSIFGDGLVSICHKLPTERFLNGGFNTGNFYGWTQDTSLIVTDRVYEGSYSCRIAGFLKWVQQLFVDPPLKEDIITFEFWNQGEARNFIIYYDDTEVEGVTSTDPTSWVKTDLMAHSAFLGIPEGALIKGIRIKSIFGVWTWVDGFTCIA